MKTKIKILAVALGLISAPAMAQFYVGGGVGRADHQQNRADWLPAGGSATYQDNDTAYKLYVGYKYNQYLGIEGGYTNLGKYTANPTTAASSGDATIKTDSWNLYAVGTLPLASGFSLMGKAGVARNQSKMNFNRTRGIGFNATDSGSATKSAFAFGLGAHYAFNKNLGLRVEYEDLGKAGETNSGFTVATKTSNSKPTLWTVGLQYTF